MISKAEQSSRQGDVRVQDLFQVTPFVPRVTYSFEESEVITAFDFVSLKPLGKSPSGHLVPLAVAIAFESGVIKVFDTYQFKNLLFEVIVGKDIIGVTSSGN